MGILKSAYAIMFSPEKLVLYSGRALGIVVSVIAIYAIYKLIVIALDRSLKHRLDGKQTAMLLSLSKSALRYTTFVIILITVLQQLGINITALLAGAGILGLAVSFGSQNLIRDIISGIFIIIEKQYYLGDEVQIMGIKGKVERMSLRLTVIKDEAGATHSIPNGNISVMQNFSR